MPFTFGGVELTSERLFTEIRESTQSSPKLDYKNPTDEESTSVATCQISPDFKAYRKHFLWQHMGFLVDVLGVIATPVGKRRDPGIGDCRSRLWGQIPAELPLPTARDQDNEMG